MEEVKQCVVCVRMNNSTLVTAMARACGEKR